MVSSTTLTPKLPTTFRALMLRSTDVPPEIEALPMPLAVAGSAILRIHATSVISYSRDVYLGNKRAYRYALPLVPGTSAIARVAAVGPDASLLQPGQLVLFDCTIRGRDDHSAIFLAGGHEGYSDGSKKLMAGEWRHGTFAEYAKVPLENCHVLDEARLCRSPADGIGLGYKPEQLLSLARLLVPFGGLNAINLRPGETVIVTPATGAFGGPAVQVALTMGAHVIAMGRNKGCAGQNRCVALSSRRRGTNHQRRAHRHRRSKSASKGSPISVFFDISPPSAHASTHVKSCTLALSPGARVSLMGGFTGDIAIPHLFVMHHNIRLQGTWMYRREDIRALIRIVETGVLPLGEEAGFKITGRFGLEEVPAAFDAAAENAGMGEATIIMP